MNYKTSLELKKRTITNETKPLKIKNGSFSKWNFSFVKWNVLPLGEGKIQLIIDPPNKLAIIF